MRQRVKNVVKANLFLFSFHAAACLSSSLENSMKNTFLHILSRRHLLVPKNCEPPQKSSIQLIIHGNNEETVLS